MFYKYNSIILCISSEINISSTSIINNRDNLQSEEVDRSLYVQEDQNYDWKRLGHYQKTNNVNGLITILLILCSIVVGLKLDSRN